jgi:hypothetical protein
VVDPEDLLLAEHLVQPVVELLRRRQVDAERLLEHDPAVGDQVGLAQRLHDRQRRLRGDTEVVEPAHLPVPLGLRVGHDAAQPLGALGPGRPAQQLRELRPGGQVLRGVVGAELPHGLFGEGNERVRRVLVERRTDDPDVSQQPGLEQVQQARQQLATSQVTGGTEQDHSGRVDSHDSRLPQRRWNRPCRRPGPD